MSTTLLLLSYILSTSACLVSELRKAARMTQEQLAEKADISYDTITSIEHGQQFATLGNLHRLAKALKVHPMELLRNQ